MEHDKPEMTRRGFLSATLSGLFSAGLIAISPEIVSANNDKEETGGEIIYRQLGKTGIKLPVVGMGLLGTASTSALVKAAYEKGITHFDSAAAYQMGREEQMVGRTISELGVRDKVVLATKILIRPQRRGIQPDVLKAKAESLLDGSLRRLKTDYVDILYVHDVSSVDELQQPGLAEAMKKLKKSGKARAIGISTHADMAAVLNDAARSGDWDVVLTSINITMADDSEMMNALKAAADKGIGIIAMKTLAGGSAWPNPESRRNYSASTITGAALKWVLNNKSVHAAIPAFSNFDQLNDDHKVALNLEYTAEEKKLLTDNNIRLSLGFCRQCSQCLASCPNDTDIPALMRTHMYASQYRDFYMARTTFEEIPKNRGLSGCLSCRDCLARCAHKSVDIAAKIADLKLIYA